MKVEEDIRTELGSIINTKERSYSQNATKNNDSLRRKKKKEKDSLRSPFFNDADKIIQSKAYARYIDKTQVFFLVENDHVTHRVLHVQLVSKIARTIGRALRLNEDLIEAISLGHDIGHVPYGHLGEEVLSKLCKKQKIGKFLHNVQSIQFLDTIEDCNLTLQVLDGILCHDGEIHNQSLKPTGNADWDTFDSKIKKIIANKGRKGKKGKNVFPLTMEGCVVRMADTIAYLGRDIKDAVEVKLIPENLPDFPEKCRGVFGYEPGKPGKEDINRAIVDTLIKDVINNSFGQDTLSISSDVSKCVLACRDFNNKYIYKNKYLLREENKINKMYSTVFETCINDLKSENKKSLIYSEMLDLNWISSEYKKKAKPAEIVRDYIAGMTDRYFERVFIKMTVPERIIGKYDVGSGLSENIISSASG